MRCCAIINDFQARPDYQFRRPGQSFYRSPSPTCVFPAQGYANLTEALNPDIAVLEGRLCHPGRPALRQSGNLLWPWPELRPERKFTSRISRKPRSASRQKSANISNCSATGFPRPLLPSAKNTDRGQERQRLVDKTQAHLYDTDMIRENQLERFRLCDSCPGLAVTESSSDRVKTSLCVHLPRHSCPKCRSLAEDIINDARKWQVRPCQIP